MTLEEIRRALQDRRLSMVARATGVHHNTLANIRDGKASNPTYRVMHALSEYLRRGTDVAA
jgi:transcriptional regulator with XRE-family HTH domain